MQPFKLTTLTFLVLLANSSFVFSQENEKRFEPNDYGTTAIMVDNKGLDISLDYLDFLGLPKAWYYTTGRREIMVGISDAYVDSTDVEFKGKTTIFRKSPQIKGHGLGVAAIAAAQGDNSFGIPGVCYDCSIATTTFGDFLHYDSLMELSRAGVKVINCSWVGVANYTKAQDSIDKMFRNGTLIVAGAGNKSWKISQGNLRYYPASYDHVISVSSAMYKYPEPMDNLQYEEKNGYPYVENIRGYVGRTAGFKNQDQTQPLKIYPASTATLNEHVDILAPTVGVLRYSKYALEKKVEKVSFEATSTATPFVTGTIGLMFSLYPCLPVDEVESILKITSMNIDHLEVNKPFKGMYGAGILQTGNAVEMVYQLYNENETAYIQNQKFSRWDFKITAHSKELVIQNQEFTDKAKLQLNAKNSIVIKPDTRLRPNEEGGIHLKIQPEIKRECDLVLRDPSILND